MKKPQRKKPKFREEQSSFSNLVTGYGYQRSFGSDTPSSWAFKVGWAATIPTSPAQARMFANQVWRAACYAEGRQKAYQEKRKRERGQ